MVLLAFAAAVVAFAADQASKAVVVRRLAGRTPVPVGSALRLRLVLNTNRPGTWRRAAAIAGLAAIAATIAWVVMRGADVVDPVVLAGLGAGVGGAAGNLCDRLRRGGVVDFIDLGWWPVFNLADVAIVAGAIAVLAFL